MLIRVILVMNKYYGYISRQVPQRTLKHLDWRSFSYTYEKSPLQLSVPVTELVSFILGCKRIY
jgi:hypothetical protein